MPRFFSWTPPLLLAGTLATAAGWADEPSDAIVGYWMVDSRDAVIQLQPDGDRYEGRIAWLKQATYGPQDGPQLDGKPVTDRENPDQSQRSRPLLGLRMLWDLRYDADDHKWRDGRVYNSDDGRTYHCELWMDGPNRLKVRGYVGFSLFGGTTTWSRTKAPEAGP